MMSDGRVFASRTTAWPAAFVYGPIDQSVTFSSCLARSRLRLHIGAFGNVQKSWIRDDSRPVAAAGPKLHEPVFFLRASYNQITVSTAKRFAK